jgi:hypothetical protein
MPTVRRPSRAEGPAELNAVMRRHVPDVPTGTAGYRTSPWDGRTQYRVTVDPLPGQRYVRPPWPATEAQAWHAACVRLGLRAYTPA